MLGLFDGPAPRVRTIPASAPFLDTLAGALVDALDPSDPFALADAVVFLPNRRASRGLIEAFARRLGGAALLPAIRPLGDLEEDPEIWGPEPLALDIPEPIAPARRRFELARLVRARDEAEGGIADPVRALAFADDLCRLLDSAAAVGEVDWGALDQVAAEVDLAAHWTRSAAFLRIVTDYWPSRLAAEGLVDAAARKSLMLTRLASTWEREPPLGAVIIAGSTGALWPTRTLMRAVAASPRGVVVLPGLDQHLDEEAWSQIDPQHPQWTLRATLADLGLARDAVTPLASAAEPTWAAARRALVREALAPADATADWRARLEALGGPELIARASEGLTLIEARTEDEEATAIALMLRETLEAENATAALVTPDAALARRVEEKLARWSITPAVSVGRPLSETAHGAFLRLIADLSVDDGDPIALLALLKHELAGVALPASIAALERHVIRGPRRWGDLAALCALAVEAGAPDAAERVSAAFDPLRAWKDGPQRTFSAFADALAHTAERIALDVAALWGGPAGEAAASILRDAVEHGEALGEIDGFDAARVVGALLAGAEAPPDRGGDRRIAIWGPLEARLQRCDLVILGGLNEGVWPAAPSVDPFLPRPMRARLGLPEPETRIGLAAHDFAQLANAPRVVLTRSQRQGAAPSVASRWIWRLRTLARAAGRENALAPAADRDPLVWARALDASQRAPRLFAPKPCPPATARLSSISFSRVETLIRDPYAIYASQILGLEALQAAGAKAGPSEKGTAVHNAIEAFADGDNPQALLEEIERRMAEAGFPIERILAERTRLLRASERFVAWALQRRDGTALREVRGEVTLPSGVILKGRADRLDIRRDGLGEVVDYKTGSPPSHDQVRSGLAPQLTLEAALLARGAFENAPPARTAALVYWRFGGGEPGAIEVDFKGETAQDAAEKALARLDALLAAYARPGQPFLSKPRAQFAKAFADYDHLARRGEWADAEEQET